MKLTQLEKSWILYDVGNSAFILLISTVIPIYFKNICENLAKRRNIAAFSS
jgi:UMF1 family MFS transporter